MKTSGMIELHCHTKMSAWKGLIEPKELIRYAYEKGYKAIAITDCGNVQAFPEVYRTWKQLCIVIHKVFTKGARRFRLISSLISSRNCL